MNQIIIKILRSIAYWALKKLYNHVDKNNDKKLNQKEIVSFAEELEDWAVSLKNSV